MERKLVNRIFMGIVVVQLLWLCFVVRTVLWPASPIEIDRYEYISLSESLVDCPPDIKARARVMMSDGKITTDEYNVIKDAIRKHHQNGENKQEFRDFLERVIKGQDALQSTQGSDHVKEKLSQVRS